MKEVHVIAQGKGGVGKSLIAAIQASYLKERAANCKLYCYDTDPVNPTFSRHKALNVEVVKILTANNNIDSRNFDGLIEQLIENDGVAVVDNGAATFVPLMSYMAENQVPELLHESGVRLIVHVPMNGGQALEAAFRALSDVRQSWRKARHGGDSGSRKCPLDHAFREATLPLWERAWRFRRRCHAWNAREYCLLRYVGITVVAA